MPRCCFTERVGFLSTTNASGRQPRDEYRNIHEESEVKDVHHQQTAHQALSDQAAQMLHQKSLER